MTVESLFPNEVSHEEGAIPTETCEPLVSSASLPSPWTSVQADMIDANNLSC
jgi:hypothetical protein